MRAWSGARVPRLPGCGLPVRVHDTASGRLVRAATSPTPRMYVCGITPYDATHLGHAATYVAFDLLHRAWLDAGQRAHYTQNVTDVDDPLLERAAERGEDWRDIAAREIELFREDMAALRVLPPRDYVGVVEAVPVVAETVEVLRDRGAVYDVDGDLYFSVASNPRFGQLTGLPAERMRDLFGERGGDPDRAGKKDPLDSLLWQAARPGEPAWDSPLGPGRPGWHVECTAIALAHLGQTFDVQGGGNDLAFPHHEICASEAAVATGAPLATAYVHSGMVGLDGEKMSKSRGNLVFVSRLRAQGHEPAAIRLALLAHHYRADWEWRPADLGTATARLARWRTAVSAPSGPPADGLLREVREQLAGDLDAPGAVAAVDRWVAAAAAAPGRAQDADPRAPALVADLADALLGVDLRR